jgi:hypothetical protein
MNQVVRESQKKLSCQNGLSAKKVLKSRYSPFLSSMPVSCKSEKTWCLKDAS